jgi:hypothetical protein
MKQLNRNFYTSRSSYWQILGILLLFVSFLSLVILFLNPATAQAEKMRKLQEPVQSALVANYSIDAQRGFVPQISLSLVREFLRERGSAAEADGQFVALLQNLQTLVPTVTPDPNMVLLAPDTPEPTTSLTVTSSSTVTITLTETETFTPTPTKSVTPWIVTYTWTPWPPSSSRPTPTLAPAIVLDTETPPPAPIPTIPPTPTFTNIVPPPISPTNTVVTPANTIVTPTNTEVPPTATVTTQPDPPVSPATPIVIEPPRRPTATSTPQPTKTPEPTREPKPTKVPKDTKEPKDTKVPRTDGSDDVIILKVPMLSEPVIIERSSSTD